MKTVTLEEKLIAQVKNIIAIVNSDNTADVKLALLEAQKDYLDFMINNIFDSI